VERALLDGEAAGRLRQEVEIQPVLAQRQQQRPVPVESDPEHEQQPRQGRDGGPRLAPEDEEEEEEESPGGREEEELPGELALGPVHQEEDEPDDGQEGAGSDGHPQRLRFPPEQARAEAGHGDDEHPLRQEQGRGEGLRGHEEARRQHRREEQRDVEALADARLREDHQPRHEDPDGPLGRHAESEGEAEQQRRPPPARRILASDHVRVDRQRDAEHQQRVRHGETRHEQMKHRRRGDGGHEQSGRPVDQPAPQVEDEEDHRDAGQRRRHAGRALADPEQQVGTRDRPVGQHRHREARLPVELGNDRVGALLEEVSRPLGEAGLGGVDQAERAEGDQERDAKDDEQDEDDRPAAVHRPVTPTRWSRAACCSRRRRRDSRP
jgi:hypothetical protein